jgi:hypothetical protein
MTETKHAIRQDELGETDVLKLTDIPIPEPGMGEIVMRVHAAGMNPVDIMARQSGVFALRKGGTGKDRHYARLSAVVAWRPEPSPVEVRNVVDSCQRTVNFGLRN